MNTRRSLFAAPAIVTFANLMPVSRFNLDWWGVVNFDRPSPPATQYGLSLTHMPEAIRLDAAARLLTIRPTRLILP
jgi:hypothetical protein